MNRRLVETIQQYGKPLREGQFIDAYNRNIREDGLSCSIRSGDRDIAFVAVEI